MKIAVLSGKGGAGKTLVAVNLAASAERAVYVDCDVEEPNGRLFFKPEGVLAQTVSTRVPVFDSTRCTGCRQCVAFCRFNALICVKEKPMVFPEVCHACGGCRLVCPADAISEAERPVGVIERGRHGSTEVVTGILNPGEASGMAVIRAALEAGEGSDGPVILDCPPGSACAVMESVSRADCCLLVAEPTAFGFDNFKMVYELAALLGKPCGVVVNKMETPYQPLERFCRERQLPVLLHIPYSRELARMAAGGVIAAENGQRALFDTLWTQIGGVLR